MKVLEQPGFSRVVVLVSWLLALGFSLSLGVVHARQGSFPPYSGTVFPFPNTITTENTPSEFSQLVYTGRGNRFMFDRRFNAFVSRSAFLFDAIYSDGLSIEFQVNPEFETVDAAQEVVLFYAEVIGRLPRALRTDVRTSWIHMGDQAFGGGNNNLLIHTGTIAQDYITTGILEEVLVHEAVHTSLDARHRNAHGWVAAQQSDAAFISQYAQQYPQREDLAESVMPWLALRCAPDRTPANDLQIISTTIPHRIAYLDALDLDLAPVVCPQPGVIYVNTNVVGGLGNGSSWANAYSSLQAALTVAQPGNEIWVAAGTYRPGSSSDRAASFQLRSGVALYGGFAGTENRRSRRDWQANPTILSGDINNSGTLSGNSHTVVNGSNTDNTAILDGFIVSGGNADAPSAPSFDPRRNGGGMFIMTGSPTITNVKFIGNSAAQDGGGLFTRSSSPRLTNVVFSGNRASVGGGIWNGDTGANPTLTNVTFSGNLADFSGGMRNWERSNASIRNSVFWNNRDSTGSGTARASIDSLSGTIVTISSSLVQGCNTGGNWIASCGSFGASNTNLPDADPQFIAAVDPSTAPTLAGKLQVLPTSPVIDAGNNSFFLGANTDPDGQRRLIGQRVDLGAFEATSFNCPDGGVVFVNAAATGTASGADWDNAFTDLRDALRVNNSCEIWVAAGTYLPSRDPLDREASFQLKNGVALYGGFAGDETQRNQRNWQANRSILSGDINSSRTLTLNSFSVVNGSGTDSTAILDGFTITRGNADKTQAAESDPGRSGGGMYTSAGSPTLANLIFSANSAGFGGGMSNVLGANPTLSNVSFSSNSATSNGGGMTNDSGSSPILTNVSFSANSAGFAGGGMENFGNSSPSLTNVIFSGNRATTGWGGGLVNFSGSSPTLTNVSSSGNSGGGMTNQSSSNPMIRNSIFWNNQEGDEIGSGTASIINTQESNPSISYSLVQGCNTGGTWNTACGSNGGNNLADADPLFMNPVDPSTAPSLAGNLHLQVASPAIDAGSNAFIPTDLTTDLDGNPRIFGGTVDLGAFEAIYLTVTPSAGIGGNIDPDQPQRSFGESVSFDVIPAANFSIDRVDGSCGGSLDGSRFVTAPIVADCTVTASFKINTYSLGGSVSGLVGSGLTLSLDGVAILAIDSNGDFSFTSRLDHGSAWTVSVASQPTNPSQTCMVTNASGAGMTDNVTNIEVICSTNQFTIGGTVSGLTGSGLVLQKNGEDILAISENGSFTFPTALPDLSDYAVSVLTEPSNPSQTCMVINGTGTLAGANVLSIDVTCNPSALSDAVFRDRFQME